MQIDSTGVTIAVYSAFFFLFFIGNLSDKGHWKRKGVITGFVVALYVEMWGFPLSLFIITSVIGGVRLPYQFDNLAYFFTQPRMVNDDPFVNASLPFRIEYILSRGLTLLSIPLIVHGWYSLKRNIANGLVMNGTYNYSRNPQYVGLILFVVGMVLYWPTLLTVPMGFVLCLAYYRLALSEEKQLSQAYGQSYKDYSSKVPRFIGPGFLKLFKPPKQLSLTEKIIEIIILIPFILWFVEALISWGFGGEALIRTYWLPIAYIFPVHTGVIISLILLMTVIFATKIAAYFAKQTLSHQ